MPKPKRNISPITVVEVAIADLKLATYNPRKHTTEAIARLKESIRKFGLIDPVIANAAPSRKNIVIGGHMRLKAAKELGHTSVPVVYVNIPDVAKEKELNLRLNRNVGEWDYSLLKDFDPTLLLDIGFNEDDLSNVWDDALETEDDGFDVEKALKEIKKPKTKFGDLYQLGPHRLLCGDATDPEVVKRLVGTVKPSMIYCDPPYNIALDYDGGIGGKGGYGGKTDDKKTDAAYGTFLKSTVANALAVSAPATHVFYWADQTYIGMLQSLFAAQGLTNRRVCLWIKNNQNPVPQVAFNKAYEPCIYATRGKPFLNQRVRNLNEVLNKEVGSGSRLTDDILDLMDVWLVDRLPGNEYQHPTQKPPTLHEKSLRRCTRPGDAVMDLFGGSGSTLIACEQLKRKCFATEIEPIFCDVIIKRYEALTNDKAKLLR
jgi:DNA modification methylase